MIPQIASNYYGIYIHIPFCFTKCSYCNFYSSTDLSKLNEYFIALNSEIKLYKQKKYTVDTIYFGGGTPSIIDFRYIYEILEAIYDNFHVVSKPEITIEINPGTVGYQKIKNYHSAGINRLSIGVQSTCNETLSFLGRSHDSSDVFKTFSWSREIGFNNIGIDLIYGIPEQSTSIWEQEMWKTVKMNPEHISCYLLDLDSRTAIGNAILNGDLEALNENVLAYMLRFTGDFLNELGYLQYEISNFAKRLDSKMNDLISKHNTKYWNLQNYIGFGPSANSYSNNIRWWNHSCLSRYIDDIVRRGILPISGKEELTFRQQIIEFIYLGLRQNSGIDISLFENKFSTGIFTFFGKSLSNLLEDQFIQVEENRIKITKKGLPLIDSIVSLLCL